MVVYETVQVTTKRLDYYVGIKNHGQSFGSNRWVKVERGQLWCDWKFLQFCMIATDRNHVNRANESGAEVGRRFRTSSRRVIQSHIPLQSWWQYQGCFVGCSVVVSFSGIDVVSLDWCAWHLVCCSSRHVAAHDFVVSLGREPITIPSISGDEVEATIGTAPLTFRVVLLRMMKRDGLGHGVGTWHWEKRWLRG